MYKSSQDLIIAAMVGLGCTVQFGGRGENPPLSLAANNIAHVPYVTHLETNWDVLE